MTDRAGPKLVVWMQAQVSTRRYKMESEVFKQELQLAGDCPFSLHLDNSLLRQIGPRKVQQCGRESPYRIVQLVAQAAFCADHQTQSSLRFG